MNPNDINFFISIQPCLISLILIDVAVNGFLVAVDFVLSAICSKWWHSPYGFHVRNSKNDNSDS